MNSLSFFFAKEYMNIILMNIALDVQERQLNSINVNM